MNAILNSSKLTRPFILFSFLFLVFFFCGLSNGYSNNDFEHGGKKYKYIDEIGSGVEGTVARYEVFNSDGTSEGFVAVKFASGEQNIADINNEISILKKIDKNTLEEITPVKEVIQGEGHSKIIMEEMTGDAMDYIKGDVTEADIINLILLLKN